MERKATFVAIENDGQKRTIENWKKADILLLLEALRLKNQDLYAFMQDCVTKGYRQMNLVGIQCEEPPPLGHYCTSEKNAPSTSLVSVIGWANTIMSSSICTNISNCSPLSDDLNVGVFFSLVQ